MKRYIFILHLPISLHTTYCMNFNFLARQAIYRKQLEVPSRQMAPFVLSNETNKDVDITLEPESCYTQHHVFMPLTMHPSEHIQILPSYPFIITVEQTKETFLAKKTTEESRLVFYNVLLDYPSETKSVALLTKYDLYRKKNAPGSAFVLSNKVPPELINIILHYYCYHTIKEKHTTKKKLSPFCQKYANGFIKQITSLQ